QCLEHQRDLYRHAAMCNWRTLERIVTTFERIQAGQLALDPSIDVANFPEQHKSRDDILKRIPHHVRTLRRLVTDGDKLFADYLPATSQRDRARQRRLLWRKLRKAVRLAEELSPRIDLLDRWVDELRQISFDMDALEHQREAGD